MPFDVIDQEINELFNYLNLPNSIEEAPSKPIAPKPVEVSKVIKQPEVSKTPTENSKYIRVKKTPVPEVQQIAQQMLHKLKGQPYGSKLPFSFDGKDYMAVLEEHIGGRVQGPHPGISLFEKSASYKEIETLSKMFFSLTKRS